MEEQKVSEEKKGLTDFGDVEGVRITLKIWDVPPSLAKSFISKAKEKFGNKSWLLLKDIMEKAEAYEKLQNPEKLLELEQRITAIETLIAEEVSEPQPTTESKGEEEKPIAAFGGTKYDRRKD